MKRIRLILGVTIFLLTVVMGTGAAVQRTTRPERGFELDVLVNGRPLNEYYSRGRTYVEALQGAEYELRLRNNSADRVAVALSVDGLNTIDARHVRMECEQVGDRAVPDDNDQRLADELRAGAAVLLQERTGFIRSEARADGESWGDRRSVLP